MAKKKKVDQIRELYNLSNNWTRSQWQFINQKGYEFAHDDTIDALAYACKFANPPMGAGKDKKGNWYKKKPKARDWVVA